MSVIASIQFRHFKALRATSLELKPFNVIIGPNGSGKSSLIQAILKLRNLAQLPTGKSTEATKQNAPELLFSFENAKGKVEARLCCINELVCDHLEVDAPNPQAWDEISTELREARVFLLDHYAMAMPSQAEENPELATNGANLASVLAALRRKDPEAFQRLEADLVNLLPEFSRIELRETSEGRIELNLVLREEGEAIPADGLSQGNLYLLAFLALSYAPNPPAILCIEDVDRGIHPRKLREVRDLLYRLSYPSVFGLQRSPVQVIVTTHSPYLLDQFREHPEEVVIAEKHGRSAAFARLVDRPDLAELLQEGSLGDMWYAGILGGVPEEGTGLERRKK